MTYLFLAIRTKIQSILQSFLWQRFVYDAMFQDSSIYASIFSSSIGQPESILSYMIRGVIPAFLGLVFRLVDTRSDTTQKLKHSHLPTTA